MKRALHFLPVILLGAAAFGQDVQITVSSRAGDRLTEKAPVRFTSGAAGGDGQPEHSRGAAPSSVGRAGLGRAPDTSLTDAPLLRRRAWGIVGSVRGEGCTEGDGCRSSFF